MPEVHAKLSASGSHRWLKCTPSVMLEKDFTESFSDYAAEGTLAHELGEISLLRNLNQMSEAQFKKRLKSIMKNSFWATDMTDYVDIYVSICMEKVSETKKIDELAEFKVEQRLDFSEWVPEGFGTGDFVIVANGRVEICDLKYGKGVPVSAKNNSQMMLYALGAISEFDFIYEIDTVKMTIIQPRLDSISEWEISKADLIKWAEEFVKPRAKMAIAGEGELVAGEHCTFCKARAVCRARAEKNLELAKYEFRDSNLLSNEEVADVLARIDELVRWTTDVKDYALEEALKGTSYPGFKVVEGKSNRKYTDTDKIESLLFDNGYTEIYKPKELLGLTAMEKLVGKKKLIELIGEYIEKPQGKPVLVPSTDKREVYNSAIADFK